MTSKQIGIVAGAVVAILIAVFVVWRTLEGDKPNFTKPAKTTAITTSSEATPSQPQAVQNGAPSPNDLKLVDPESTSLPGNSGAPGTGNSLTPGYK